MKFWGLNKNTKLYIIERGINDNKIDKFSDGTSLTNNEPDEDNYYTDDDDDY